MLLARYAAGPAATAGTAPRLHTPPPGPATSSSYTTRADIMVPVVTTLSNAYEMVVKSQHVIRKTFSDLAEFRARPGLNGVPLLAPFANRLDEQAFYANGRKYSFDMGLGNVRGTIPIHGFLSDAKDWRLVEAKADAHAAWVTSTLDFYRNPQWMKQFPFAHTITMTYRLADGR